MSNQPLFHAILLAGKYFLRFLKNLIIYKVPISLEYKMLNLPIYFAKQDHLQL